MTNLVSDDKSSLRLQIHKNSLKEIQKNPKMAKLLLVIPSMSWAIPSMFWVIPSMFWVITLIFWD